MKRVFEGWEARDFDALLDLSDPQIFAELALPPRDSRRSYRGHEEIRSFLRDGDETYEHFKAEPQAFAVWSTGLVFAEGSVSYKTPGARGMTSVAYWVCEVRDGKIVSWQSFSDPAPRSGGSRPRAACLKDAPTPSRRPAKRCSERDSRQIAVSSHA